MLLGMGLNLMFVAASTIITEAYRPAEKAILYGVNDFLVFGAAAISSLITGIVLTNWGW